MIGSHIIPCNADLELESAARPTPVLRLMNHRVTLSTRTQMLTPVGSRSWSNVDCIIRIQDCSCLEVGIPYSYLGRTLLDTDGSEELPIWPGSLGAYFWSWERRVLLVPDYCAAHFHYYATLSSGGRTISSVSWPSKASNSLFTSDRLTIKISSSMMCHTTNRIWIKL